jgi:hypothetical protein
MAFRARTSKLLESLKSCHESAERTSTFKTAWESCRDKLVGKQPSLTRSLLKQKLIG